MGAQLLVVSHDPVQSLRIGAALGDAGLRAGFAAAPAAALDALRAAPVRLVLCALSLENASDGGLALLTRARAESDAPFLFFEPAPTVEAVSRAFRAGAAEVVDTTVCLPAQLATRAIELVERDAATDTGDTLEARLPGASRHARTLRARVAALADLESPVLVGGEDGSGRRCVAAAVHDAAAKDPATLLFCEAGSYLPPGAHGFDALLHRQLRESAVCLHSIEALSPAAQLYWSERLARAELGGAARPPRFFATTSACLRDLAAQGRFDPELAQRLERHRLEVPPLRSRPGDIPAIADALLRRAAGTCGLPLPLLSASSRPFLASRSFPGNVAQLAQLLDRALRHGAGTRVERALLEALYDEVDPSVARLRRDRVSEERSELLRTLAECGGNIARTARRLGRSRPSLYRMIEKHGIPLERSLRE